MIALEDRIRLELRAIGLLDDEEVDSSFDREDDEVCAELRHHQALLRDHIQANNERRLSLIARVKPKMREHEEVCSQHQHQWREREGQVYETALTNNAQARRQKLNNLAIEKNYQKLIQKKKKRGGRRAPPPQVGV